MSNKSQQWAARLARFAHAQQTVAVFCAAEAVSQANFYLWKRRLARTPATPTLVPIQITTPTGAATTDTLEFVLPSGAVLRFPVPSSPALIVAVLQIWKTCSC